MEINLTIIIILIILGIIIGVISTIAGIGGGVFYVTLLILLFFMPIDEAIDTSIFVILISSGFGFLTYLKQGRTNLKLSLIFSSFSILGSLLCTIIFFFIQLDNTILKYIFATVLFITGINIMFKAIKSYKNKDSIANMEDIPFDLETYDYKKNLKKSIPLFILAGFLANLLGIGGGVINTPALNIVLGYPIHNATAISTSIIFFTAIFNTIVKIMYGKINYLVGILLGIGSVVGAILGAKMSEKMPKITLQFFVSTVVISLAIRMYF